MVVTINTTIAINREVFVTMESAKTKIHNPLKYSWKGEEGSEV